MGDDKKVRMDHIKVMVRSRPLNEQEKASNAQVMVTCDSSSRSVNVATRVGGKTGKKKYHFDRVFGQYATQEEVYSAAVQPIVK
eukprot:CAMPEP_0204834748 /NCGR_PEP_ID=MMETSP1346-20131115/20650_1 /ASSEMBLY_ACC=CAM_ASM_000771 /TAXON_ID=215587 /ORGANISM="Aplanochytrium stocchinoi, Strain GSBS06" /LENGTH=83 /DNA_ID=CAMNT_0051968243 /DNA_START=23 /DNA_END=271 /DNA_ORIENTATION=+